MGIYIEFISKLIVLITTQPMSLFAPARFMNHLALDDTSAFRSWAARKREAYQLRNAVGFEPLITLPADGEMTPEILNQVRGQLADYNFALYRLAGECADHLAVVKRISQQLGLREPDKNLCAAEDRITRLTVTDHGRAHHYIPYTNKAIGWHTDGYYNPMQQRVLSFVLHCEQPAAQGGENRLLDPDMVYIHLREQDPAFVRALSEPRVMCIPANYEHGQLVRPETCSAVFLREQGDALAMRFSRRTRNIVWRDDSVTREALECLLAFIDSNTPYIISHRLNAGEGVINNNVLHTRSAFSDSAAHKRVFYRARFYTRIGIH